MKMTSQAKQLLTMLVLLVLGFGFLCWYLPNNIETAFLSNLTLMGFMIAGFFSVSALTSPWRDCFKVSLIFAAIFCLILLPFILAVGSNMNQLFIYHASPVIICAFLPPVVGMIRYFSWKWGYSEYR